LLELAADLKKAKYAGVPVLNGLTDEFAFRSLCQPNHLLKESKWERKKMNQNLSNIDFDPELRPGAYNALNVCLRLQPEERLTLITDEATIEIAAALVGEIEKIGSRYNAFVLENLAPRPLVHMPASILDDLQKSQVSIFASLTQTGELLSRKEMIDVVNKHKLRHGHMVNINKQIMLEGMEADFNKIDELSLKLVEKARQTKFIRAKSQGGTDIEAELSPTLKWIKTSGLISPDKWGNLPGGEIFTSPYNLNGVFVVDGVVGDYLCQKYGDLKKTPLKIEIVDSRIKSLECANEDLLVEFARYTSTDENSNRVGELAIGTNTAVKNIIGHILQDEKMPGIHLAFGHPYSEHTGQAWDSVTHIDCVGRSFDIWMDDEQIMKNGKFLII
jgi:leucyl aminopeptidase (aminopeptidase T)